MANQHKRPVLLSGATGFVGGHLYNELRSRERAVVCLTRDATRAARHWPERQWAQGDTADRASLRRAMRGCEAAYYLVHNMAEGRRDFRAREAAAARNFARVAADEGVHRVVYLGGVAPQGTPSEHLASRLEVGELLRAGRVPALELRASMIVGAGSLSWRIVRDLAARLPVMVLPRWLNSRTEPVAIRDVVTALVAALDVPLGTHGASYDIPGPEALSGREMLQHASEALGLRPPLMLDVPMLSPWLSSHWIHWVTRAQWEVAREIVVGLTDDLLARDARYWSLIHHHRLLRFDQAARAALLAERRAGEEPAGTGGAVEHLVSTLHGAGALRGPNKTS